MKKIFLLFSLMFLVACETPVVVVPEDAELNDVELNDAELADVELEVETVEVRPANAVENLAVTADSVLADTTTIGFNYQPEMVLDRDFSTAWCSEVGKNAKMDVDFGEVVRGGNIGFLTGFGRDEKIFFQNNRIKDLLLSFEGGPEVIEPMKVTFDDEYQMQFVELEGRSFQKLNLEVKEVYQGSKYDDTCLAEMDFSSDYVVNSDAVAAMNYYVKNKKDFALVPYDIVSFVGVGGAPKTCTGSVYIPANSTYELWDGKYHMLDSGEDVYAYARINEFGKEGDQLTVKWYRYLPGEMRGGDFWDLVEGQEFVFEQDVKVAKSCSGDLYAMAKITDANSVKRDVFDIGGFKAAFYKSGKLVGVRDFFITQ